MTRYSDYELIPEIDAILSQQEMGQEYESISYETTAQKTAENNTINTAIAAGEKVVERLTDKIFFGRHPELGGAVLKKGQSNFSKLSSEWVKIRDGQVKPQLLKACKINTVTTTPSFVVTPRPCCLLTSQLFLDPSSLGSHLSFSASSSDKSGILYTAHAGFVDLGHLREVCDITKAVFDQLISTSGVPSLVSSRGGISKIKKCTDDLLTMAQCIAYDEAKGHEIVTFHFMTIGAHHSSFSPEDLCSNFLGTVVARRAIIAGGNFDTAVTTELNKLLTELGVQSLSETQKAFDKIKTRWVNSAISPLNNSFLIRRNFSHIPWQVGHPSDKAIAPVIINFLPNSSALYDFTYKEGGMTILKKDWPVEIAKIKTKARSLYGAGFETK